VKQVKYVAMAWAYGLIATSVIGNGVIQKRTGS